MNIVPPFGFSPARAADYLEGYAHAGVTLPTVPTTVRPTPDKSYTIGSNNFATLNAAITQAQKDGAKLPLFQYACGGTYADTTNFTKWFNGALFDSVGPGPLPLLYTPDNAINFIGGAHDIQVRNLNFKLNGIGKETALHFDSVPNVVLDNISVTGFNFGVNFVGVGNANLKIYRCQFLFQDSGSTNDSSGLYVQGIPAGDTAEIGGCLFLRCGLPVGYVYGANPAIDSTLARKHGIYCNESPQGVYGNIHVLGSVFIDCASRGVGSRRDGTYEWNVFRSCGSAADINFGNAGSPTGTGTIQDSAFFGPGTDGPPYWGGGVECNSTNVIARRLYAFSNSTSQQNPLVNVTWDSTPTTSAPAGHGPMPANTTANVSDLHGVWMRAPLANSNGRQLSASPTNIDVRAPKPGESLPTLAAYYGVPESQLYATLQARGAQDAAAIVDWCRRSWLAMNSAPIATGTTQPSPVLPITFSVQVDATGKASIK